MIHAKTQAQYKAIIKICKTLFEKKTRDYGTAWRILRLPSITDQITIKAKRIRAIQEHDEKRVGEGIPEELIGIINYSVIALMQITGAHHETIELTYDTLAPLYDRVIASTMQLLHDKNHDYQEAWRDMRVSSMTDLISMKLLRIKRIEDNQGMTLVSEGVAANYRDIINYAVFALIRLGYVSEATDVKELP